MPYIEANGIQQYYEEYGEGEPILLLHGLGSSILDWELQIAEFATDFRVIALDLRGHGRTEKPKENYSVKLFAQDVVAFLEKKKIERVNVLGFSMGGMIAFQMALDAPQLLKSMILLNTSPMLKPRNFKEHYQIYQRIVFSKLFTMKALAKVLGKRLFPKSEQSTIREVFKERWIKNPKYAYLQSLKAIVGWSVIEKIHQIQVPTLVLGSEFDYYPTEFKKKYTASMPNAKFQLIANTGHAALVENYDILNQFVVEFLKTTAIKTPSSL